MRRAAHIRAWGPEDASRVVCLHGITSWGGHFETLAQRLTPSHRVLAADLLGHGLSSFEPPWRLEHHAAAVLEAVGEARAVWVGHSFGGRLALEIAAAHPELVRGIVLLDPAIHIPPHAALAGAESSLPDRSYASFDEAIDRRFEESALVRAARAAVAHELQGHLVHDEDGRWRYRYSQAAVVTAYSEMAADPPPYPALRFPTLVVAGAESYIPYEVYESEHRAGLGDLLEVVTVPGGHSVLWDAFDETAAAIVAFLARL